MLDEVSRILTIASRMLDEVGSILSTIAGGTPPDILSILLTITQLAIFFAKAILEYRVKTLAL